MVTTSYKVHCVDLTEKKRDTLFRYIREYSRIYNIVAKLLPSLPEKYINETNPSKLYSKWIKKGSKEILVSDLLTSQMIMSAMSDAISNYKVSKTINHIKNPNIIKFVNSEYDIIKIIPTNPNRVSETRYAINIKPLKIIIPLITGKEEWGVINHLKNGMVMQGLKKERNKELAEKRKIKLDSKREKRMKAGLGVITYNLRDNTISVPNETLTEKKSKWIDINDIKTIVGVDLGINNTAVMCAIDITNISKKYIESLEIKRLCLKEIPSIKILKFKYISGFANNYKMKQLRKTENKRRRLRMEVGHRRRNLTKFTNHRVSHIIEDFSSQFPNAVVIFENGLANLKNQTWSPSDVKTKCDYKLAKHGIKTLSVYPQYTSKICHRCGATGIREKGKVHFKCPSCGLGVGSNPASTIGQYNADGNASINIALRGLYVLTRPKKERETVEYIDGSVAEPNTNPDENAQETIPHVISEAFNGKRKQHILCACKDMLAGTSSYDVRETNKIGVTTSEKCNPTAEVRRETESQKSDFLPVINETIKMQEEQNLFEKPTLGVLLKS